MLPPTPPTPHSLPLEPGTRCPRCAARTDLVEDPTYQKTKPSVGDVVVCIRCAGLLSVTSTGGLRELRDHEYRQLTVPQLVQLGEMQRRIASGAFRPHTG